MAQVVREVRQSFAHSFPSVPAADTWLRAFEETRDRCLLLQLHWEISVPIMVLTLDSRTCLDKLVGKCEAPCSIMMGPGFLVAVLSNDL